MSQQQPPPYSAPGQGYPPQQGYAPQQGYPQGYPPQQGYPQQGFAPQPAFTQQSHNVTVISQPQTALVVGGCRACGGGPLTENFTACGILIAICFFPIGILCCMMMTERRCARCGALH